MSTLLKDLAPLFAKLIITIMIAYMVFTGRLSGSLLGPVLDSVGRLFG